ncbi:MAG: hypothetical protein OXC29_23220 [Rhodococcus sp.]|nr:hypothetical protein [Rhodococcus sp. (in: high G+C Gram-positive bacteria)]
MPRIEFDHEEQHYVCDVADLTVRQVREYPTTDDDTILSWIKSINGEGRDSYDDLPSRVLRTAAREMRRLALSPLDLTAGSGGAKDGASQQ